MNSMSALRDNLARLTEADQVFARSLLDQAERRGLSDKQLAWVDKLTKRATSTTPRPDPVDVPAIVEFMANAAALVKHPRFVVKVGEQDIRLSIAGSNSRTPGHINLTSADSAYEDRQFFGRIGPDGRFSPSLSIEPETQTAIVAALRAFAADPAGVAALYGKMMGSCCFCSLPLSDAKSLDVGYGKICARKYGLPYGDKR